MQHDDRSAGEGEEQVAQQPVHPARDFFSDWHEEEESDEDVAEQPTVVPKRTRKSPTYPVSSEQQDIPPIVRNAPKEQLPSSTRQSHTLQDHLMPTKPPYNNDFFDDEDIPANSLDIGRKSTKRLMDLSGMMRTIRPTKPLEPLEDEQEELEVEDEWWPDGIKQTGLLPVVNLYGKEPFGRTQPRLPAVKPTKQKEESAWKALINKPAFKVALGLLAGALLLFLVTRIVDIPSTIQILKKNLSTPFGIVCALLSGVAFLLAYCIRGVRWKLFLNPIGHINTIKAIQLFLVGIFLNFLLPIRGGEVAKSLMLKRIANIPINQSLPTVAMDKALDLMPALFIMAIVPFLGVTMDIKLWLVLGMVGGLLIGLIFFVALAAWKRTAAIALLQKMTAILPKGIGNKIAGFATGFVDALLAGASQPGIFIPAILLTLFAVLLDGLFAMLAFWTVGVHISFGTAIFGYTVYNMFYILPTPPGQVGSNEAIGLLVFYGLLHLDSHGVAAMFIFSHPWAAVLMCLSGMGSLSALGMTISSAMKVQSGKEQSEASVTPALEETVQVHI
ncbi:hypothetical protein KSF_024810 [Reticulibacter mediterranei]|uniref:Flippase-like domain-containing protein n=1 Tax=Reticulibacter mediterranei TaxID=2778369 RepID=A0A8J3IF50_9CHLR|nr:lysylphosphatidylglycerol synthase transmembrane domain-containing protein [Reticulibacter mediterranei]GHO92433.1 hypothetical protein KSF_024810 [Reticulibacter mediterranei]